MTETGQQDGQKKEHWLKRAFGHGNILGTIERTIGIWTPGPNDKPDDTNPVLQAAFVSYLEKRLEGTYSTSIRYVTEPGTPNLTIQNVSTGKVYETVTCYRSQMFIGEDGEAYLPWTTQETYDKLQAFSRAEHADIYVIIGLHGYGDAPNFVFSVPLDKAAIDLKKSVLAQYEIKKGMPFEFRD
ncbi:MAG TPA: hypothetical protein O0X27_00900 [Methanocorpusculum sp.]|nr:hypothetical protein [Methanocorpusculum sp.]